MHIFYAFIIGYLLGSIPTAYWLGLIFYKCNVFEKGSKNMGATNVYRVLGTLPFAITLLGDILKGMAAVLLTARLLPYPSAVFTAAAASLIGHTLSFWVKFKGGKGVATGLGVFLALATRASVASLIVFGVTLISSKMVSLSSIFAALSLPLFIFYFQELGTYNTHLLTFAAVVAIFVVFKHKANISRIISGTEAKLGQKAEITKTENEQQESGDSK